MREGRGRERRRRRRGSTGSGSPTTPTTGRGPCPAGRPSGSRWPGRSPPNRACCCSTSRWPRSTSAPAARCGATCAATSTTFDGVRLLVTHDPVDAYALADRVVDPRRRAASPRPAPSPRSRAQPRSRYIADLVGVNLSAAADATAPSSLPTGGRIVPAEPVDGAAFAIIQPNAVALYLLPPDGSPRNVWAATVADIDRQPDRVRVRLDGEVPLVAEITPAALDALVLRTGDPSGPPSRRRRSRRIPPERR